MADKGQDKIWHYFQGEGIHNFDEAVPRLDYLFGRARKHGQGRKLQALNIGVGNGWLERRCHGEGWDVSALDPGEDAIRALAGDGIDAHTGAIENMPFPEDVYDIVFCSEVLEHLDDTQLKTGLKEISRIYFKPEARESGKRRIEVIECHLSNIVEIDQTKAFSDVEVVVGSGREIEDAPEANNGPEHQVQYQEAARSQGPPEPFNKFDQHRLSGWSGADNCHGPALHSRMQYV